MSNRFENQTWGLHQIAKEGQIYIYIYIYHKQFIWQYWEYYIDKKYYNMKILYW